MNRPINERLRLRHCAASRFAEFRAPVLVLAIGITCVAQASDDQSSWLKVGGTFFGGDEKSGYGSLLIGKKLDEHFSLQLGVSASAFQTFTGNGFNIRHGGREIEGMGTYRLSDKSPVDLSLGITQPNTPARSSTIVSYRLLAYVPETQGWKLWGNIYGTAGQDSISMLGAGGRYPFNKQVSLELSGAVPIEGNNTVNTSNGNTDRSAVYSIGLRFALDQMQHESFIGLAITNQLGWTTGMSATPSLGNQPGISVSYQVRF